MGMGEKCGWRKCKSIVVGEMFGKKERKKLCSAREKERAISMLEKERNNAAFRSKPRQSSSLVTSNRIHGPNSILLIYSLFASKCVIMIVTLSLPVLASSPEGALKNILHYQTDSLFFLLSSSNPTPTTSSHPHPPSKYIAKRKIDLCISSSERLLLRWIHTHIYTLIDSRFG